VIVGTAFVRALLDAADAHAADQGIPAVSELTAELSAGVRRLTR
jgi:tryptophan synthase alpha subunit